MMHGTNMVMPRVLEVSLSADLAECLLHHNTINLPTTIQAFTPTAK